MMKRTWLGIFAAGLLSLGTAGATPLITDDEAKLPPPKGAISATTRGILRGPKVEVISPNEAAHSPLRLQLKFETFGGARIDIESVKVLYLSGYWDTAAVADNPAERLGKLLRKPIRPSQLRLAVLEALATDAA